MAFALDGYSVGNVLGEGGSGTVYAATKDTAKVAIKVLRADLSLTPSEVKRFLDEAALMQRISHASVVPVLGSGLVADGRPYLVMPRLEGETLAARLHRSPLTIGDALALFEQLADAVETLHAAGIIHRDLKPENIFLVGGTRVVLLDFGIAKDRDASPSTTTTEGRVRGTPAYMAPERFFSAPASVRSDVYELAVTLYEMLVGALPWSNPEDVSARLDPAGGEIPAPLWEVLRLALASNAQTRPASVRALHDALKAADTLPPAVRTATIRRKSLALAETSLAVGSNNRDAIRLAVGSEKRDASVRPRRWPIAVGALVVIAAIVVITRDAPVRAAFCATASPAPQFCADFEAEDFRAGFYNAGKQPDPGELNGGTVRVLPATDGHSRRSELAIPALADGAAKASAMLIAQLSGELRDISVTFRMRIADGKMRDEKAAATLFSFNFGKAGAINITRKQAGLQLSVFDAANKIEKAPFAMPPLGAWKTYRLHLRNYAVTPDGRGDVTLLVDGALAKLALGVELQALTNARLDIGIVAAKGSADALRVELDDLLVSTSDGIDPFHDQ